MTKVEATYASSRIALNVGRLMVTMDADCQPIITIEGQPQEPPEAFSLHWSKDSGQYLLNTTTDISTHKEQG